MWNEVSDPFDPPTQSDSTESHSPPAPMPRRSVEQIARLEQECREALRSFAYHPHIRVVPLHGSPPSEYQITYRVRTVKLGDDAAPQWIDRVEMHVWLPPEFPDAPPLFRPLSPVFHPNISAEGVVGLPPWDPRLSLCHVISQVGFALAYRTFNKEVIADEAALAWTQDGAENLPTDPTADFFIEAGGKPLARIRDNASKTLSRIRQSILDTCNALLQQVPPGEEDIGRFCESTGQLIPMFLSPELPEEIRREATELEQAVRQLPAALPQFDSMRQQHVAVTALSREAGEAAVIAGMLDQRCAAADAAFTFNLAGDVDAVQALRQIPQIKMLRPWDDELARQIDPALRWLQSLRSRRQSLEKPLLLDANRSALLNQRLSEASRQIEQGAAPARSAADHALAIIEPAVHRSQALQAGLRRCIDWRTYAELLERGLTLERRLRGCDIAAIQSYYIDTAAGSYGPFEFEQPVTLGSISVTVQSRGRRVMDVVDAKTARVLGRAEIGQVTVEIKDDASGESYPYVFRVTNRCDDLHFQAELLATRTSGQLSELKSPLIFSETQFARLAIRLGEPEARARFESRQREAEARWAALAAEARELHPLKERLATHYLIKRYSETLPQYVDRLQKARSLLRQAMARLGQINAISTRNKAGQLMVPGEFAVEHGEMTRQQRSAEPEIDRLQKRIDKAAGMIQKRLADPILWGAAKYPALKVFAPISPEMTETMMSASDEKIMDIILRLEELLNISLRPASWTGAGEDAEALEDQDAAPPDMIDESPPQTAEYPEPSAEGLFEDEANSQDQIIGDWPGNQ